MDLAADIFAGGMGPIYATGEPLTGSSGDIMVDEFTQQQLLHADDITIGWHRRQLDGDARIGVVLAKYRHLDGRTGRYKE